jgi:beta-glucosidase
LESIHFFRQKKIKFFIQTVLLFVIAYACSTQNNLPPYKDANLPVDERVRVLASRLTIAEKISQLSHTAPGIDRLGIIPYELNFDNPYGQISFEFPNEAAAEFKEKRPWENMEAWEEMDLGCLDGGYWNEALHGIARSGLATAFPQCIGLGSTWNPDLIQKMTEATAVEARVHNNVYGKKLTYWSPTINILRDPRWGRNEESYSEDPYLLSRMAVAFVKGLQGNDPKYLSAVATVKHFVANNSEFNRHGGSSDVSERLLREYYFPAFQTAIVEGGALSVMSAYNALNGIPASANSWLLTDVLRKDWGFKGYVVSDCGAVSDIVHNHKYETDPEKAVALAVKAGTDLECETCGEEQFLYDKYLPGAVKKGYIAESEIDVAVSRLFRVRMLLGEFDNPENVPYTSIPEDKLDCKEHQDLALQIARETMVLLKNDGILPLNKEKIKSIAVIGPNANVAVMGGYSGFPSKKVTPLMGIKELVGTDVEIKYQIGCLISDKIDKKEGRAEDHPDYENFDEALEVRQAIEAAKNSDVALLFVGTNLTVANEEADRSNLDLPGTQLQLIKEVYKVNKNAVVILINGMSLTINWVNENIPAILEAWYPGQSGGTAIAEVLFGEYNPGGRLPVTFYKNLEDLPPLGDYDITKGRTYMYFKGNVLYPFGHGLSYTDFEYNNLSLNQKKFDSSNEDEITISIDVKNIGKMNGDEVVQVYIRDIKSSVVQPERKLRKFKRITLNQGETKTVKFVLHNQDFAYWDEKLKDWNVEKGDFEFLIGSSSADIRLKETILFE